MRRMLLTVVVLGFGGCVRPDMPPAPEEIALDRFEIGEKLMAQGRYADAAPEFEYAIQHRWRWKAPYLSLARCQETTGHDDAAIATLEKFLHVDPSDDDAMRGLGRLYDRRGDPARALVHYRKLWERHPEDAALAAEVARLLAKGKP